MEKILQVNNLYKSFAGRPVISDVSFEVYSGEVFGFLGPNGAGKSTTIKMILGLLSEDGGSILINGYDHRSNYEKSMEKVGGIVENPEMYENLSGRTNIEMYARLHKGVTKERISEVIDLVGMTLWANEKIKKYSLGMKQRMGIAQALVHKPNLLLLDEPTNGLDAQGIIELRGMLRKLAHEQGVAVLVSSHQLAEMEQMCDRICIISRGKIAAINTIEELRSLRGNDKYTIMTPNAENAAKVLGEQGYGDAIENVGEGCITLSAHEDVISGIIKQLALSDIVITGVNKVIASLEQAYMDILNGGVNK